MRFLAVCAICAGLWATHAQPAPGDIVLTVGATQITAAQFEAMIGALPEASRAYARGAGRKQFADQLVKIVEMAGQARRMGIDKSPDYAAQMRYRQEELLSDLAKRAIADGVKVDDAELRSNYAAHARKYERARASHILIRTKDSPVPLKAGSRALDDSAAEAQAKELAARARRGDDFTKLAAEYSDDSASASKGGELGWLTPGTLPKNFEAALFSAQPGQILGPVRTEFGFHIVKVEERKTVSFDEAKVAIEAALRTEKVKAALAAAEGREPVTFNPRYFGGGK
jgi:peptidyl-prolyl cis-trans isomerase C